MCGRRGRRYKAPEAEQDIADIWHFIAQDNPLVADQVIDAVKSHFRQIVGQPRLLQSTRASLIWGVVSKWGSIMWMNRLAWGERNLPLRVTMP